MENASKSWTSPIPRPRWNGYRIKHRGLEAFENLPKFEAAQVSELDECLKDHEKKTLGRLLARGKKAEIEVFIRSHGANPIFDPQADIDIPVGVAKADLVNLGVPASVEANRAILNGDIVHMLFQAGDGSRFKQGPFYKLILWETAQSLSSELDLSSDFAAIEKARQKVEPKTADFILKSGLGPMQPILIRAALRRVVAEEMRAGRIKTADAPAVFERALKAQKILFFIHGRDEFGAFHYQTLKDKFNFFGFDPQNIVTIEQQLVRGITANEDGVISLLSEAWSLNPAGHLYALLQASRPGDFTTYSSAGAPLKPAETDAFGYLLQRGAKIINVVRINDMDRHTTEIVNGKALSYALQKFSEGFVNVIEGVANPTGQKGGTGTTFGDPDIHVLTETHENSFPSLSRVFETAMNRYIEENKGRPPAYNAMRQWADLNATRTALREFGGRIVFVPRQLGEGDQIVSYLGVDMPMGDLSLFHSGYKSRMFQFEDPQGRELQIHDMKIAANMPLGLHALQRQLEDPHITAAVADIISGSTQPLAVPASAPLYGAPAPELN